MIISFDIDNTLIPYSNEFEVEQISLLEKLIGAEPLRKGTRDLFKNLEEKGHEVWIYTTSYRSIFNLRKTFQSYGLKPSKYINETINRKFLNAKNCSASKNPKLFGIDLHIDDSQGVAKEAEQYGFNTIIVDPQDGNWAKKVMMEIEENCVEKNLST